MKFKLMLAILLLYSTSTVYAKITKFSGLISIISIDNDASAMSVYVRIKGFTSAGICKQNNVSPEIEMTIGTGQQANRQLALLIAAKLNGTPVYGQLDDIQFIGADGRCELWRLQF